MLPNLRAVLFDLDNTLYDRDLAFETWARGFVEEYFADFEPDRRAEVLAQMLVLDARGHRTRPAFFTQFKARYPSLPYDVDALCSLFYSQWLVFMTLAADTVQLLDSLKAAGIPFGIVTNGTVHQNLKIDQLGLRSRARCLFISEVFGAHKPDAAIFQAAATALEVPCAQILFVGDNAEADIYGAQSVGMRTAWLHRGASWPDTLPDVQPDYRIASLGELLSIFPLYSK